MLERGKGGDRKSDEYQSGQRVRFDSEYTQVIEAEGIDDRQARRWQQVAKTDEDVFESVIHTAAQKNALTQSKKTNV